MTFGSQGRVAVSRCFEYAGVYLFWPSTIDLGNYRLIYVRPCAIWLVDRASWVLTGSHVARRRSCDCRSRWRGGGIYI